MDIQTFWHRVETLADEFNIGHHPFVQAVHDGNASKQELRQFAIEHYEMTVRDSGPYIAQGYCSMAKLDAVGAEMMAENFAEEAMVSIPTPPDMRHCCSSSGREVWDCRARNWSIRVHRPAHAPSTLTSGF
jgi:hypothetical protein